MKNLVDTFITLCYTIKGNKYTHYRIYKPVLL
nr:MAG TPA: hypothetical protein [Caudoviricetes sp.]